MILAHSAFEQPIKFSENYINMLVIENKQMLNKMINSLINMCENSVEGEFVLSKDGKAIGFSAVEIITDLFRIDINQRKIVNELLNNFTKIAEDEKHFADTHNIISKIYLYIESLVGDVDYNVTFDEASVVDLMKISNIKFDYNIESNLETLLELFKIYTELIQTKLFIIINLHQFTDFDEQESFCKDIIYHKYNVLFIETFKPEIISKHIKVKIIDNDLCDIS